jgi:hypothetical protein
VTAALSSSERQLIGQRERVAKTAVAARAAQLVADFETQLDMHFGYDTDEVWKAAVEKALAAVAEAQVTVAAQCRELGIPSEISPGIDIGWRSRGQNAVRDRRAELRRLAYKHIAKPTRKRLVRKSPGKAWKHKPPSSPTAFPMPAWRSSKPFRLQMQ